MQNRNYCTSPAIGFDPMDYRAWKPRAESTIEATIKQEEHLLGKPNTPTYDGLYILNQK